MSQLKTGVIGLGAMGGPMARHLSACGLLCGVWNRTADKADALAAELDTVRADSPSALAAVSDVLLTCVSADKDLAEVINQASSGLREGMIVIDASTVSPAITQQLAGQLAEKGVGWVDAPVSGGVEGAINGRLSVMAGGDFATFSRVLPILEAFSASVTHMGPIGSGQATKAVNQVMVGGIAEAVCEALALGEKLNLPSERLLGVLTAGAADSWFLRFRGKTMLENNFKPGFKQALLLKDLKIVQNMARDLNINLQTVDLAIKDYSALVAAGDGDNDTSGLIKAKRVPKDSE